MAADSHPLVTVITPSYNQCTFLRDCLQSVSLQTYPAVEHIVVDGGSADGTLDLLRGWAHEPNRRFISEPDRGMYDAVNKGLGLAKGKLLAYLNCDDLYFPHSLQALVEGWCASGADVVYGDMVRVYEDGRVVFKLQPPFDRGFYGFYYQLGQPTTLWTAELARRLGGFDASLRYGGDSDFFLRAARFRGRFARVDEFVCLERHSEACLSAAFQQAHRREISLSADRHGGWRGPVERALFGPLRVVRGLGRQLGLACRLWAGYRSQRPTGWGGFWGGRFLRGLVGPATLVNVLPAPLLRRKISVGSLDWTRVMPWKISTE